MKIQTNPTTYKAQMRKLNRLKVWRFINNSVWWINIILFWVLIAGIMHSCQKVAL